MRLCGPSLLLAGLLVLSGCEEQPPEKAEEPAETQQEATPAGILVTKVSFAELPGWAADDLAMVGQALRRSCDALSGKPIDSAVGTTDIPVIAGDWKTPCAAIRAIGPDDDLRAMIEDSFTPFTAAAAGEGTDETPETGLFTGYFEAEVRGARTPDETFKTPLYAKPADMLSADLGAFDPALKGKRIVGRAEGTRFVPYRTRGEIDAGVLAEAGEALFWLDDPVDAFLLHVQGSGRVILPDGEVARVGFAAHNGHGYKSIGRALIDRGVLKPHEASWSGIRGWVEANPEEAADLFAVNPRFIFFREITGDGPIGSLGVALTPERSLAVDNRFVPPGIPIWLDTVMPGETEGGTPLRRLMVAQDTGGAIKGAVRGDFFWGYGAPALAQAGKMRSPGRYFLLLPNDAAERLSTPEA